MYVIIGGKAKTVHANSAGEYYYTKNGKRVYTKSTIHSGAKPLKSQLVASPKKSPGRSLATSPKRSPGRPRGTSPKRSPGRPRAASPAKSPKKPKKCPRNTVARKAYTRSDGTRVKRSCVKKAL